MIGRLAVDEVGSGGGIAVVDDVGDVGLLAAFGAPEGGVEGVEGAARIFEEGLSGRLRAEGRFFRWICVADEGSWRCGVGGEVHEGCEELGARRFSRGQNEVSRGRRGQSRRRLRTRF